MFASAVRFLFLMKLMWPMMLNRTYLPEMEKTSASSLQYGSCSDLDAGWWCQGLPLRSQRKSGTSHTSPTRSCQHRWQLWISWSSLVINNRKYLMGCTFELPTSNVGQQLDLSYFSAYPRVWRVWCFRFNLVACLIAVGSLVIRLLTHDLYLNNKVFLSRNYQVIVAPRKFEVLKTNICSRSEVSRANMLVLRTSNFQGATIRPIVPRHKHSIGFIVHY